MPDLCLAILLSKESTEEMMYKVHFYGRSGKMVLVCETYNHAQALNAAQRESLLGETSVTVNGGIAATFENGVRTDI